MSTWVIRERPRGRVVVAPASSPESLPVLGNLSLSSTSFTVGVSASGTILGAAAGTVLTLAAAPPGFVIDSGARTWSYDGSGSVSAGMLVLVELLSSLPPVQHLSTIAWSIKAGAGQEPSDTTPDAFTFTDATNVAPGSTQTSDWRQITGINAPATVSVTGGQWQVADDNSGTNATALTASNGTVAPNKWIRVRHIASTDNSTAVNTTLTIGGRNDTFTSTTLAYIGSVTFPSTINAALPVPVLTLNVGQEAYPPSFLIGNLGDAQVGDTIWIEQRNNLTAAVVARFSRTITVADAEAEGASFGLSAVTTGTFDYVPTLQRGTERGDYGAAVLHGPDNIAPTISGFGARAVTATSAELFFTSNEGNGTAYFVVTSASTVPTDAQIIAGQNAAGAPAIWAGNVAVAAVGEVVKAASGLTASTAYYRHAVHVDAKNNKSNVVTGSLSTLAPASYAKLVANNPAGSTDQSQYVTVDSTRFNVIGEAGVGATCLVRAVDVAPTNAHFEATVIAGAVDGGGLMYAGFCDAADPLGPAVFPEPGKTIPGITLRFVVGAGADPNPPAVIRNGSAVFTANLPSNLAVGDSFAFDRQGNQVTIRCKQGSTVTTLATVTLASQVPTNWTAFVGSAGTSGQIHTNFGAEAFGIAPLGTCAGW